MRKLLVLTLILALAATVFADDALVLPKGVIRVRATGAYTMATETFDADSEKVDLAGGNSLNMFNLGASLEYGIIEGVNIAAKWIPGYVVYTKFEDSDKAKLNGPFDLFLGAKVQILGDRPVAETLKNETMRFAVAAGAVVPLPGADFDEQRANILAGDEFIAADVDRHVFGVGGRLYFDYVGNKMFYFNLYSEFIKYFKKDQDMLAFTPFPVVATAEMDYGYQLTLEAEPHFETPVAPGVLFKAGLPVTYVMSPEVKADGTGIADTDSYSLEVRPNVALFITTLRPPVELEVGYLYPVAGKNVSYANSALTFQLKVYVPLMKQK